MATFKKHQTVYFASTNFCRKQNRPPVRVNGVWTSDDTEYYAVVERVVDACGARQMTFFDRNGMDSVFGRRQHTGAPVFATADEAFAYLETVAARNRAHPTPTYTTTYTILRRVRPDYAPDFADLEAA